MKTYYVVVSSYGFGQKHPSAAIVRTCQAEKKPTTFCYASERGDTYTDYFEDREEAERYVKQARGLLIPSHVWKEA